MANEKSSHGVSATALLGIAFIVLKLCKVIDWDWLWVLTPFWIWIPIVFLLAILSMLLEYKSTKPVVRKSKFQQRMDEYMQQTKEANDEK